jgi:outer membrane protein assembly factor BamB
VAGRSYSRKIERSIRGCAAASGHSRAGGDEGMRDRKATDLCGRAFGSDPSFLVLLAVLMLTSGICLGQHSVSTFHGDAQRSGRASSSGPLSPMLLWTFRTLGSIDASPVISHDGTVYLASTDNKLYALTSDGQLKWSFTAHDSIFCTPTLDSDGIVLFADLAGWYYSVYPDGSLKWSRALSGGDSERRVLASPAVAADGRSYVAAWNDQLYAFDPSGNLLWQLAIGGGGHITSSPALDSAGNVYLATLDPSDKSRIAVFKFEPSSQLVWKFSDNLGVDRNRIISTPAIDTSSQRLYIGAARDGDGCMYALRLADGRQAFKTVLPKGIVSSSAIATGGKVYVGCMDGNLYALDGNTGAVLWEFSTGAYFVLGSPSVDSSGRIYFGDSDGIVHALSPWGKELWRSSTQANISSAPAIADDGTLYVTSYDSGLYAIGQAPRWRARPPTH